MAQKFVFLNKEHVDDFKYSSRARSQKFVSVEYLNAWIANHRLSENPLPMEKTAIAQNEILDALVDLISETNV